MESCEIDGEDTVICPMCKSNNISDKVKEVKRNIRGLWKCRDCGYESDWGDFVVD